ncbi:MAG: CNNM domain-containing protein [Bacillus sp. (in: firmicutes)]
MTGNILIQLFMLVVLLGASAFFSAAETSLMALSKIRVRYMVDENVKGAKLVQRLVENPSKLIGSVLVGNNIANISASALATSLTIELFEGNAESLAGDIVKLLERQFFRT